MFDIYIYIRIFPRFQINASCFYCDRMRNVPRFQKIGMAHASFYGKIIMIDATYCHETILYVLISRRKTRLRHHQLCPYIMERLLQLHQPKCHQGTKNSLKFT
jgi:hypothetical protein